MRPKIIFMPHANIQYSQLKPEKRQWVMQNCYDKLFEVIDNGSYKIAFEASGITIDAMAQVEPRICARLKRLVKEGKIEPVSSPYIHFMNANVPPEVCRHSLIHGLDTWEKHIGVRPKTGWNPECGWAGYIPQIYHECGIETLVMDADSFFLSFDEIRSATKLGFDVQGHSNKNHLFKIEEYIKDKNKFLKYITNASVAPNGLKMIFRSDCMANPLLWYLMGATEGMRAEPVSMGEIRDMFAAWKERIAQSGEFIMPYAEDAEYIGSSAYFYVKQFNQARFFEHEPQSVERFREILDAAAEDYDFAFPSEVTSDELIPNEYVENIEMGVAWHGGTAKAWANTEYSRIMDAVCRSVFDGITAVRAETGASKHLEAAMKALASAYVSDSRWPPAPTSPGRFNVRESLDDMYAANEHIRRAMEAGGISQKRSLYSPNLMQTQIKAIDDELMGMTYFGE
ncbi:MAG: glycoside hydrolase family 57 [Clostridia bacterium]|nr:glycoside hydrolase family 57 [Clostridia bacterium]